MSRVSTGCHTAEESAYAAAVAGLDARVNPSGTVSYRVHWRQDGQRQWETFRDPAEAERFRQLVNGSGNRWPRGWVKGAGYAETAAPTFRTWAEKAIRGRSRASARAKSDYRRDLAAYAYPLFGDTPLELLTGDDSDALVAAMLAAGRSAKTITNVHGLVSSILGDAARAHPPLLEHNPFRGRLDDLPDVRVEEMVFLEHAEFDLIHRHVPDFYRALAFTLVGTGLRFGEATALRPSDLALTGRRRSLRVVRAWKRLDDGSYAIGEPKTKRARRTLNLSPALVDVLAEQARGKRADQLLFGARHGGQLLNSTFHDLAWAPAVAWARVCKRHAAEQLLATGKPLRRRTLPAPCDCPGVLAKTPRVHDLRHTYASWLIADGLPLSVIARRMGHASITTADNRYGHLLDDLDDRVDAAIERALGVTRTREAR